MQDERLLVTRHKVPEAHGQHLIEAIPQLLDPCLVHMHELTTPIQLADHLRRMLDQVAVLFFQAADIHHTLFDLGKRPLEILRHVIEGIGKPFNFIASLQLQSSIQSPASDFTDPVVQQLNGAGDPTCNEYPCPPQQRKHNQSIEQHFRHEFGKRRIGLLRILPYYRNPLMSAQTSRG